MYYWFRPPIHLCESPDDERTLCGTRITGLAPTIRPLPAETDAEATFANHDAGLCPSCAVLHEPPAE